MPVMTERQFAIFDDVQGIREDIPNIKLNKAYSPESTNVFLRYGRAQRMKGRLRDLLDGSVLASSAAPTTDPMIVNKKFVDDYLGLIRLSDTKAQNTDGGGFTAGAWQTRTLNTEDTDAASLCTLAANQITLSAGDYDCRISCPALRVNAHQARLYNTTGAAVLLTGTSEYSHTDYVTSTRSIISGRFTVAASQALEVQHYCGTTKATYGFGVACNFTSEIYTIAEFYKRG